MVSHPHIPTTGGQVSKVEAYSKLIHHIEEAQNLAHVISHICNTEADGALMAKGWGGIGELMKRIRWQVTEFAKKGVS